MVFTKSKLVSPAMEKGHKSSRSFTEFSARRVGANLIISHRVLFSCVIYSASLHPCARQELAKGDAFR